uniref:Structure-specific endonuclease subunit SLX4 n=1 Tax=Schistocephalus solidus TaxID=70667 RepID=A0A0X3P8P1_SCHSO
MSCGSSIVSCEFCHQNLSLWSVERQILHKESCCERTIRTCRQCPACLRPLNFDISKSHLTECSHKLGLSVGQLLSLDRGTGSERTIPQFRPKGKKVAKKRPVKDFQNSTVFSRTLTTSFALSRRETTRASKAAFVSTSHLCVEKSKRLEILSTRLSSVFLTDSLNTCIIRRVRNTTHEKRGLWALSSNFNRDDKLKFYVSALVPPLIPCCGKIGDNLRRFSQIPGNSASGVAFDMSLTQEHLIPANQKTAIMNHDPVVISQSPVSPCSPTNPVLPSKSAPTTAGIFTQMVGSPLCADLSICLDSGELVPAHRFVFAAWNPDLAMVQEKDASISAPGISKSQLMHLLTALYTNDVAVFAALEPEEEFVLDCWQLLDIVRPFSHSLLSSQPPTTSPPFKAPPGCRKRPSVESTVANHSAVFSDANSVPFLVWTSPPPSKVLSSPSRVDGATYSGDLFAASDDSILTTGLPVSDKKAQGEENVDAVITSCTGPSPPQTCSPASAEHLCPQPPESTVSETKDFARVCTDPASSDDHHPFKSLCDSVPSPLPTADPPSLSDRVPSPSNEGFQMARTIIPLTPQEFQRIPSPDTAFSASDPPAFEFPPSGNEHLPSPSPPPLPLDMSCFFDASMPAPLAKRLRMTEEADSQSITSTEPHSAPSSPVRHPSKFSPSERHADRIDSDPEEGDMSSSQPVLSSYTPLRRPAHSRPSASVISFSPITPKPAYEQMPTPHLRRALSEYGLRNLPKKKAIRILNHIYDELHPYVEVPSVVMEEVSQASPTRAAAITPPLAQSPCLGKENASPTMCQVGIRGPSKPGMPPDLNPVERETAINFASSTPTHPNLGPFNALFGKARNGAEKTQNAEIQQRVYEYLRMNDDIYYNIVTYTPLEIDCLHALLRDAGIKLGLSRLMSMLDEWGITFTTKNNRKANKPKCLRPTPRY